MDPVSVTGLSKTASSMVERLAKTLNLLLRLSTRLKFADVKTTLLIGFLGSINAAVYEIGNIVERLSGHIEYQKLAEHLNIALDCTKVSLSFLESQLAELQSSSQDEDSLVDKFTVLLRNAEFESYINEVSTNVTALNLVLNALQRLCLKWRMFYLLTLYSRSLLEQQGILDNPDAKSILVTAQDEISLLHCIADDHSVQSKQSKVSETSAALDVSFDFDPEILRSRSYGVAFRSHLRQAIASGRRQDETIVPNEETPQSSPGDSDSKTVLAISQPPPDLGSDIDVRADIVDTRLKKTMKEKIKPRHDASIGRARLDERSSTLSKPGASPPSHRYGLERETDYKQLKILLLGTSESGKSTFLKGSKLWIEGGWTKAERESFSTIIYSNICQGFRAVLEAMETLKIPLEAQRNEYHAQTIVMQPSEVLEMPFEVVDAIMQLSSDKGFQATLEDAQSTS